MLTIGKKGLKSRWDKAWSPNGLSGRDKAGRAVDGNFGKELFWISQRIFGSKTEKKRAKRQEKNFLLKKWGNGGKASGERAGEGSGIGREFFYGDIVVSIKNLRSLDKNKVPEKKIMFLIRRFFRHFSGWPSVFLCKFSRRPIVIQSRFQSKFKPNPIAFSTPYSFNPLSRKGLGYPGTIPVRFHTE